MRAIFAKGLTASMIAGAALLVSACGGSTDNTATENVVVTDLNTTDPMMDGTMTDNMTAVDGAMGNDMMMTNTMESNMMMGNAMVMNTTTTNTMVVPNAM